ncbi:hypothetical protein PI124_g12247 [Phytophthora idaei]|nr:hypothetical protein PI124_g12247 [Phytophthora idaei]
MSAQSTLSLVALDVNDATLDNVAGTDGVIGSVNVVELGTVRLQQLTGDNCLDRCMSSSWEDEDKEMLALRIKKVEACVDDENGEGGGDKDLPPFLQFLEEKKKKKESASKTNREREAKIAADENVDNHVGPLPRKGYALGNPVKLRMHTAVFTT